MAVLLAPSVGHFSFVSMAGLPHEFALFRLQVIGRLHVLADLAARTLTPIARPMWWLDPRDEATFTIHDQFALGDDFIVAPVVERGATTRNIYLTQGVWRDPFAEVGHHALGQAYSLGDGADSAKPLPPSRDAQKASKAHLLFRDMSQAIRVAHAHWEDLWALPAQSMTQ